MELPKDELPNAGTRRELRSRQPPVLVVAPCPNELHSVPLASEGMVKPCAVYLGAVKTQFSDTHTATSGTAEARIGVSISASLQPVQETSL